VWKAQILTCVLLMPSSRRRVTSACLSNSVWATRSSCSAWWSHKQTQTNIKAALNVDEGLIFSNFLGGASHAHSRNPQNTKFFTSPDMRAKFVELLSMLRPRKWRLLCRKKEEKKNNNPNSFNRVLTVSARALIKRKNRRTHYPPSTNLSSHLGFVF